MLPLAISTAREHELRAYCERRGWRDLEVFSDQISGAKFLRPGLDALMAAVRVGKVQRVVSSWTVWGAACPT